MKHISDIRKFERCEKLYWLSQREPKPFLPFVFYNESILQLSLEYLMITSYFEGVPNDPNERAMQALQTDEALCNARFEVEGLRIKVPLMLKEEDHWNLYFLYPSVFPKEHEAQKIADALCVLDALAIPYKDIYAIHLHASYVREKELDVRKLLVVSDSLYNAKNYPRHTILELVETRRRDVFSYLPKLTNTLAKQEVASVRSQQCTRGGKCSYYDTCFPTVASPSSILNLVQSAHKFKMYEEGIQELRNVDVDRVEGNRHQYAQIMAARNNGLYIDKFAMHEWIHGAISYPISYLDFEWETYAFPPYEGMKPYDVLTFQYSLHVEDYHKAPLQHFEYLGVKDCREAFIQHLIKHIPEVGSVLVFNMDGAEKLRLKQLAVQFPKYKKELDAIGERMVDLSLPFSTGNIYDLRMEGLFSLKKLVSIFSTYSYQDLDISYGMEAVRAWRLLDNLDDEQSESLQQALLSYCAMDTFGEVLVYHALLDMVEGEG